MKIYKKPTMEIKRFFLARILTGSAAAGQDLLVNWQNQNNGEIVEKQIEAMKVMNYQF
ncbi:MAG: hypothetical protein PUD92_05755 [Clostridiales bacterium]|nr:hypothetical protein [Clostridiales bacterium]